MSKEALRGFVRRAALPVVATGLILSACSGDKETARDKAAAAQEAAADAQQEAAKAEAEAAKAQAEAATASQAAAAELAQDLAEQNQECADSALGDAQDQYIVRYNNPATEIDEANEGLKVDEPKALEGMRVAIDACMEKAFSSSELDGFEIQYPSDFMYAGMPTVSVTTTTVAG
jgi:multidrug efflux pump subunit AcrA (membrane-fusion protein)